LILFCRFRRIQIGFVRVITPRQGFGWVINTFLHQIFSLFFAMNSYANGVFQSERLQEVAYSKFWLKLLHYEKKILRDGYKSTIIENPFFLSQDGRTNPKAELIATLQAFSNSNLKIGPLQQHAQCAFPERYRYLKKELSLHTEDVICQDFLEWKQGLDTHSVTLVYSSAYPNNPASMFGHTFLRFNKKDRQDLLDYGANYGANVPTDEGSIKYAFLGLFGGYLGGFSIMPYYMKVNEYNNAESRDLWEYDLNFTQEELERLINHFWELFSSAQFKYYFIDYNCSYHILALLEVAKPEWNLTQIFYTYVLPADTIKVVVNQNNSVASVKLRPALRKKMFSKINNLSSDQKKSFHRLLKEKEENIPHEHDVESVDAALAYYEYIKAQNYGKLPNDQERRFKKILMHRTYFSQKPKDLSRQIVSKSRPDLGHHSSSAWMYGGFQNNSKSFIRIGLKWGLHDALNEDQGYESFSQIDFIGASFDYVVDRSQFQIYEIKIAEITSWYPFDWIDPKISWRVSLKAETFKDFECLYCLGLGGEGGAGLALQTQNERALFGFFLQPRFEVGKALPKGFRLGPSALLALNVTPIERYKLSLQLRTYLDLLRSFRSNLFFQMDSNHSYSLNQMWELRLLMSYIPRKMKNLQDYMEVALGAHLFF